MKGKVSCGKAGTSEMRKRFGPWLVMYSRILNQMSLCYSFLALNKNIVHYNSQDVRTQHNGWLLWAVGKVRRGAVFFFNLIKYTVPSVGRFGLCSTVLVCTTLSHHTTLTHYTFFESSKPPHSIYAKHFKIPKSPQQLLTQNYFSLVATAPKCFPYKKCYYTPYISFFMAKQDQLTFLPRLSLFNFGSASLIDTDFMVVKVIEPQRHNHFSKVTRVMTVPLFSLSIKTLCIH